MRCGILVFWSLVAASDLQSADRPPVGFERTPTGSTLSAGHFHTCALRRTPQAYFGGIAHCWGFDGLGQVSGTPTEALFVQLSSGHFHACGVTLEQKVLCWGEERETALCPLGLFRQVSSGQFHTCGLTKDGEARCWGDDQLSGSTKPPAGQFVQISSGLDWSCGIRPNATVVCWGANKRGQSSAPPDRVVQVASSTSSYHTCAITYDANDLICWGDNRKGEAEAKRPGPFAHIAVGFRTTCAITLDATQVFCWGLSAHLFLPPPNRTWDQITLGRDHICALDADGYVFCAGQPTIDAAQVPSGFIAA